MKRYLSLADTPFEIEGGESLVRLQRLSGFAPFDIAAPDCPQMRIVMDTAVPSLRQPQALYNFYEEETGLACELGMDDDNVYFTVAGRQGQRFTMIRRPEGDYLEGDSCIGDEQLRFSLWMALALLGNARGIIPIHASTVVCRGKAILFLGESGTGKSTRSRLWLSRYGDSHLLNDDSPLLSLGGSEIAVYGSPWSGKTPCYRNEHHPIAAVVRLVRSDEDRLTRLGTAEALSALLPSCPPALALVPECLDNTFVHLERLLSAVPIFRLQFRVEPTPSAAPLGLIYEALFGESER